jgi:hypothetical protein
VQRTEVRTILPEERMRAEDGGENNLT